MENSFYKLRCKDCNYQEEIYSGFTCEGDFVKPYYCSNCKKFKHKVLKDDSHSDNQPHICKKCSTELSELIIEMPDSQQCDTKTPATVTLQVYCPKCKSENVEIFWCGLWD